MIKQLLTFGYVVEMSREDYERAIDRVSPRGLTSGIIYDAVVAETALRVRADKLYSIDTDYFYRLGDDVAELVTQPG